MKLNEQLILTDVDGVLVNWIYGFSRWMIERGFKPQNEDSYRIHELFNIDSILGYKLGSQFNESAAIGWLPAYKDSIKYIKKLHEDGFIFHAITSLGTDTYATKLRKQNLNTLFGDTVFEKIDCLPFGADKTEALKPYADSGCFWVEDHPKNAEIGLKLGLSPIVMRNNHNKDWNNADIPVVNNWKEIYELINK